MALQGQESRLRVLGQQGCLKVLFPRRAPGQPVEAVMANISGGVASGDRLDGLFECGAGAALTVTTQAAERCYRARSGEAPARVAMHIRLEAGACCDWLPQETILFDGAALDRRLSVEMARDARCLAVESRVFGRGGSGEQVDSLRLADELRVVRAGRLIMLDRLRRDGDAARALLRPAIGDGARLFALVLLIAPDAGDWLGPVRAVMEAGLPEGVLAAASNWNDLLAVRVLSVQDAGHRVVLRRILECLRGAQPLPRVWQH